eukprot:CAMPEP_0171329520 /NCGR_PEP_ID=MMETSP0878-20121228/1347_1 /TAXON_ID=67004 /ORGANISM="Thalassiosira weissflogii, Strain CCMP1336" /LENGTH=417 /DNA_ID=CAMNT_0011829563 /DNA_START=33 /DNA_END=1286 /DNA_ORIENTATION=+
MSSPPEETPIGGDLVNDTLLSLLRQHVNDIRRDFLTMQSKFGNTFISCITQKPSNETLLSVAFISFMSFATIQFSVAFFAKSEAMIGDSAAMVVDALTYGLNLFAERRKNDPDDDIEECENSEVDHKIQQKSPNRTRSMNEGFERIKTNSEKELDKKRRNLKLEIVPPVISVSILIVVIGVVLQNAIRVLILDSHRNKKEQSLPNLAIMMTFSILNLLLDIVNVTCFARAKHLMGYNTNVPSGSQIEESSYEGKTIGDYQLSNEIGCNSSLDGGTVKIKHKNPTAEDSTTIAIYDSSRVLKEQASEVIGNDKLSGNEDDGGDERVNLNMCSAYTHVFADTLRSTAVIIASIVAIFVESVTPEEADATAAVVVSIIIFVSLIPLFRGLLNTLSKLRKVNADALAMSENECGDNDLELV